MKIGAHISTAKPFSEAINRAKEIGCECIQIFANPPQRWNPVPIPEDEINKFIELNNKAKLDPVIIHGIYLLNLASSNPYFYQASVDSLKDDMKKAEKLGAMGVNFHVGSTKGMHINEVMEKVSEALKEILSTTTKPFLILENSAGAGNVIGDTLDELGLIIKKVNSPRLKVLIDTAHAFQSGYDLKSENGLDTFLEEFDKEIGLSNLVGFHLNDSLTVLNSKRDRHADIGEGEIGIDFFKELMSHPKLKNLFGILETPQNKISWKEQIELLKDLRN